MSAAAGFRVLVAEDESTYARTVGRFLQERGHEVKVCPTARVAQKALADSEWDVLLLDLKLPDANGIDVLAQVRREYGEMQTIIVTGFANVESAIEAMRLGAFDYLTKPPNFDELAVRVERAAEKTLLERENRRLRFQVSRGRGDGAILTRSAALQKVLATLDKVAAARTPVLIEGESGVGKELLAQHLHRVSPRSGRAFVDLNCAAVPEALLESELFGHERGAFTGASNEKPGLVEVADGGTLFLDEVGEMPAEIQSKLLRVLDSGAFYRVGATRKRRADFRLVAATNRDLRAEVAAGRFRKDLFYRIHGLRVVVPPLRERPEDIPYLVERFARALPMPRRFSTEALAALQAHDWPGNVRELQFAVERAGLLAESETIGVQDLPPEILEGAPAPRAPERPRPPEDGGPDAARVRAALEKAHWRRGEAATLLGISPRTLHRWMKTLGLALLLWLGGAAHAATEVPRPPRVVMLVTIDTLRADHLGTYGYRLPTSPFLDRLAAQGVLFENAISTCSHTAPAHASIFTGLLPNQHRLRSNDQAFDPRPEFPIATLAQVFGASGYETGAFSAVGFLASLTPGFVTRELAPPASWRAYRQAPQTIERVTAWLRSRPAGARLFAWIHLYDPHTPDRAPASLVARFTPATTAKRNEYARRAIVERGVAPGAYANADALAVAYGNYDAEIAFADAALGGLFESMQKAGLNEDALWIVTADHGEGLGNHDELQHGPFVYNEQLHVPLIVYGPGRFTPRRVGQVVRHVDLLPSLVELIGAPPPPQAPAMTGRSLLPLLGGQALPPVAAFSERRQVRAPVKKGHWEAGEIYALQDAKWKYIVHTNGTDEFFDLAADPLELTNLAATPSPRRDAMKAEAERLFHSRESAAEEPPEVEPASAEELEALGYVH